MSNSERLAVGFPGDARIGGFPAIAHDAKETMSVQRLNLE